MKTLNTVRNTLFIIGLGVLIASCSDGVSGTRLTVLLTDAPAEYIGAADVVIGEVNIRSAEGETVVLTDAAGEFNLLDLQNGVTAEIASIELPEGTYVEARMVVEEAMVTLAEGFEFVDGTTSRTLKVPSGMQSGIKIKLDAADGEPETEGVDITGDMVLVFDFDVTRNFRIQGNPHTPAGIKGVSFTPVIRAVVRDIAASISGTVTDTDMNPLEGQIVKAVLIESTVPPELQTQEATALTDADGNYSILYLAPGSYEVSVIEIVDDMEEVLAGPVAVDDLGEGEDRVDVDFEVDVSGS